MKRQQRKTVKEARTGKKKRGPMQRYAIIKECRFDYFIMEDFADLAEAKHAARMFYDINEPLNDIETIMLVQSADFIKGDFAPIEYK